MTAEAKTSWASDGARASSLGLVLLAAALVATPAVAFADEPSDIDRDAARTLVQQGDALMEKEAYQRALEAYRRADDIMKVPTTSIEVGKVSLLLGRLLEAHRAFSRAAGHPPRPGEPAPFTKAREEAERLAEELDARIPRLEIAVEGPKGSEVDLSVDGEPVEAWGKPFPIDPGSHELTVRAAGYHDHGQAFVLQEGESRLLEVRMERKAPAPDPEAPAEQPPTDWWPMTIAGFATAGAGVVVGSITGGLSLEDAASAKSFCNDDGACTPEAQEPLSRSRTLAHVSTTSFVLAGVGAAVGVVGLVLSLSDEERAALLIGPGQLGYRGSF